MALHPHRARGALLVGFDLVADHGVRSRRSSLLTWRALRTLMRCVVPEPPWTTSHALPTRRALRLAPAKSTTSGSPDTGRAPGIGPSTAPGWRASSRTAAAIGQPCR